MRKISFLIAAATLLTSAPANAQDMMVGAGRQGIIHEAAKSICRTVAESDLKAGDAFDREVSYLRLNRDEKLYMLSLCVLYLQGRTDQAKARR